MGNEIQKFYVEIFTNYGINENNTYNCFLYVNNTLIQLCIEVVS